MRNKEIVIERVSVIKETLKKGLKLNDLEREWLETQRKSFKKNPKGFSKERVKLLDPLIPLLGFDWRRGYLRIDKKTEELTSSIRELLMQKKRLAARETRWLYRQGVFYRNNPEKFPEVKIKKLDSLIPLLGYDWREGKEYSKRSKENHIQIIRETLEKGNLITEDDKAWLKRQQLSYQQKPEAFTKQIITSLDSLIPLLGYNWRLPYSVREEHRNEMLKKIRSSLKSKRKIPKNAQTWLNNQRHMYLDHPKTFSAECKKELDSLIPLLQYDWKVSVKSVTTFSFPKRVELIKEKLENGSELNDKDRRWIAKYRRIYLKDPASITDEQLTLLNSLNLLLGHSWFKTGKPIRKIKSFLDHIADIRKQGLTSKCFTKEQHRWLRLQRKKYVKNKKKGFNAEKVKMLDSLIPIIGFDWKVYRNNQKKKRSSESHIKEIKKKLKKGIELEDREINWLRTQRFYHENKPEVIEGYVQKLDNLTPLLGYDWKVKRQHKAPSKTFEEHIRDIKLVFQNGEKLSKTQVEFLRMRRVYYHRDPESFSAYQINVLNGLSEFLGGDWRETKKKVIPTIDFDQHIKEIRTRLKQNKDLTDRQKRFLVRYRGLYRNNKSSVVTQKIEALDSLNSLLGYDWKTFVEERV